MNRTNVTLTTLTRALALPAIVSLSGLPLIAAADQPSYATGPSTSTETIKGTIYEVTGKYTLTLQDERGFEDSITLHNGTLILPTGLSLGSGQIAQIVGHTDGKTFAADEIDVDPGSISSGQPLVPVGNYSNVYNSDYPGYAFGFDGAYSPYGYGGYYGGISPGYYNGYAGGYYGGGSTYYVNPPQVSQPKPQTPTAAQGGPTVRRPVGTGPAQFAPPTLRYPTSGSVRPIVRAPQPAYRAPAMRVVAPQPSQATRSR